MNARVTHDFILQLLIIEIVVILIVVIYFFYVQTVHMMYIFYTYMIV